MDRGDWIILGAFLAVIALLCALYAWSERRKDADKFEREFDDAIRSALRAMAQEEERGTAELERMWRISR